MNNFDKEIQKGAKKLHPEIKERDISDVLKNARLRHEQKAFIAGANSKANDQRMIDFGIRIIENQYDYSKERNMFYDWENNYYTTEQLLTEYKNTGA